MNWFERYGIVGMSFFVFLGISCFCFGLISIPPIWLVLPSGESIKGDFMIQINDNNYSPEFIGGIIGFSFLPAGYIIMIFSQWFYYGLCSLTKRGVHQRILKELQNNNFTGLTHKDSEATVEATLTYIDRMKVSNFQRRRCLDEFIRKRFDVIAINLGIITAYLISLLIIFFMKYLIITYYLFLVLIVVILFMALLQKTKFSLKNLCLVKWFLETSLCRNRKRSFIKIRKELGIAGIIIAFVFVLLLILLLQISQYYCFHFQFLKEFSTRICTFKDLCYLPIVVFLTFLVICIILPIILLASNHTLEQQIIEVEEEIFRNNKVNK